MTLVMLLFGRLVFSILDDPASMLRNGFLLMSLPGLALSLVSLFGRDGPDAKWTWSRQFLGGAILAVTVGSSSLDGEEISLDEPHTMAV